MPTCRGSRKDGAACGQWAIPDVGYCRYHDPLRPPPPRNCTVCRHPRRAEIERLLAAGVRLQRIAGEFRVSVELVRYHRARHLAPAGAEGAERPGADPG
jgi:hypothetical protein